MTSQDKVQVLFKAYTEEDWEVFVDGRSLIESVKDLDVASRVLDPLWAYLGISMEFDDDDL